jgi:hypothetical protein
MNQVQPHSLWLGHAGEGRDFRAVFDAGIKALVQLAVEEPPPQPPRELIACHFPLLDSAGNSPDLLLLTINTVATLLRMHIPTLVSCNYGMSRAPAVAAAALAMLYQQPPQDWLERVLEHHPGDVSPGFWNEIVGVLAASAASR